MVFTAETSAPRKPYKPRDNTKAKRVLAMMQRPEGATIEELMSETGWKRPAVRGFVVGPQFAKLGYRGVRRPRDGQTDAYFAEEISADV